MTNPRKIVAALLADRSGSVQSFLSDAQGMVDAFVAGRQKQAAEGLEVLVRLTQFDGEYDAVYPLTPAAQVPAYTLVPRGNTALLDAIGRSITELGEELAAMPEAERPGKVIFGIMTDGLENASREWTFDRVAALVKQQENDYGWDITYLGANQDAVLTGGRLGVRPEASLSFGTSSAETRSTSEVFDSYVVASASAGPGVRGTYSDDDRKRSKSR